MVIFDFDGVLIDSLDEVVLTVYNATTALFVTSLAQLPGKLVDLFRRNRFHVQSIGDAISLMGWCLENFARTGEKTLTIQEFQTLMRGTSETSRDRTNRIYAARKRFIERDQNGWMVLHKPYQPLWDEVARHPPFPFVILTNKNHDATLRLCGHFGLLVEENDIYAGDNSVTKEENMRRIRKRFGGVNYFCIDDSVKNLQALDAEFNEAKKVITLLYASWGYTGPQDGQVAQKCGYPVLRQADLISLLRQQSMASCHRNQDKHLNIVRSKYTDLC